MGIQNDAGRILLFVYYSYVNNRAKPNAQMLLDETKWDGKRIDRAIKYLKDLGALELIFTAGQINGLPIFILKKITPLGINIIENKPEFKRNFGFGVNIGVNPSLNINWSVSEK